MGRRTAETACQAWADFYRRTDGQLPPLVTTDAYAPYLAALVATYGVPKEDLELTDAQKEEFDWASLPPVYFPVEISYATVQKVREQGRVVGVQAQVVCGTEEQVAAALAEGTTAPSINTSYVERYHGTHRRSNARKARKVYTFSKELSFHVAVTWLCVAFYNFGWTPRTLRVQVRSRPRRYQYRTPAMVAGLASRSWSMAEILSYPLYPSDQPPPSPQQPPPVPGGPEGG